MVNRQKETSYFDDEKQKQLMINQINKRGEAASIWNTV